MRGELLKQSYYIHLFTYSTGRPARLRLSRHCCNLLLRVKKILKMVRPCCKTLGPTVGPVPLEKLAPPLTPTLTLYRPSY